MLKDLSDEAKVTASKFIGSDLEAAEHYVLSPNFLIRLNQRFHYVNAYIVD